MTNARPQGTVKYDNSGRVVLVTGGSGGIGRTICEAYAQSGAEAVVSVDVNEPHDEPLGEGVEFFRADVSDEESCRAAVEYVAGKYGGLDVLVNNAAIQSPESYKRMDEYSAELWNKMLGVNLSGYAFMAKHALKVMKSQGSGVVINLASAQGHRTARGVPAYGPIKAANLMQTRQWGVDYARDGIRVVSISPGAIETPLLLATMQEQGGLQQLANRHPIGRLGLTSEIAAAVLWCSSGDASFITATDLEVDGGLGAFAAFADPYPMPDSTKQT